MKAKVKVTGEIVEVEKTVCYCATWSDHERIYNESELDFNLDNQHHEATIGGWMARDGDNRLYFHYGPPCRTRGKSSHWTSMAVGTPFYLPSNLFPDLTWKDEPIEVEITIKPKER